jgi:hypothetical protein
LSHCDPGEAVPSLAHPDVAKGTVAKV